MQGPEFKPNYHQNKIKQKIHTNCILSTIQNALDTKINKTEKKILSPSGT